MTIRVNSTARVNNIRDKLGKLISQYFGGTLGREPDILNIVCALIYYESRFDTFAVSPKNPTRPGTFGAKFLANSAISSALASATPAQKNAIEQGLCAVGLMQVLGAYFIRGASPTGQAELERLRSDLSSDLLVNPGESVFDKILGEDNIDKALKAGLIILESKYKISIPNGAYYMVKGDAYGRRFPTKIAGAVAAYLGLGAADMNKTTPEAYSNAIVGGNVYALANGKNPIKISDSILNKISQTGPVTNGSDNNRLSVAGCSAGTSRT